MENNQITITLSKESIKEIINAYNLLGDLLETILPPEKIYQKNFRLKLEQALKEVETGRTQQVQTFDEFVK